MKRHILSLLTVVLILSVALMLGSCSSGQNSGGGPGIGNGTAATAGGVAVGTTQIAGKVSLSSTVQLGKATLAKMEAAKNFKIGKPGSKTYIAGMKPVPGGSLKQAIFGGVLDATQLTNATVDLYDAIHPEWLYPVASTKTDSNGDYSLKTLINASYNKGATYTDGDPIPTGLYTMVAYKVGVGLKPVVSVQAVVNRYDGFQSVDFEVVDSDIEPSVQTMFGVFKNTDGTETWGSPSLARDMNGAIQISFSMPMWRDSLTGISISPSVEGNWSLSADWRTATFYLKPGVMLQPNTVYTVKVNGSDTSNPVFNVYTNPVRATAVGYFVTGAAPDYQGPTAQWKSPSLYDMASPIDIIKPIRIQVNKPLDVNGLYLDASPSVGDRTSVYFLGTETDSSGNLLYIYEFGLGRSLMLNTQYTMTVMGGRDLAGNALTPLTASITTKAASDYNAGIDASAVKSTQDLQAEIYDVFGKWVRSMNDRNIALFQGLMTGDFYMEYSTINGIDSGSDLNHDGRYSLNEFSLMLLNNAFPTWAYCGATITGAITPNTYITIGVVDPATGQLDMSMATLQFKLNSTTTIQNQMCSQTAPSDTFYLTLKKYNDNSPWVIRRASQGIDDRNVIPSQPDLLKAGLYARYAGQDMLVPDGGQLASPPMPTYAAEFKWDPVPGVQSLVLAAIDARTNCTGFAAAFSPGVTSVTVNTSTLFNNQNWPPQLVPGAFTTSTGELVTDVTSLFGLDGMNCNTNGMMMMAPSAVFFQPGGEYYWEVIGFKSTDVNSISGTSFQTLVNDIGSISLLKRFSIAGLYRQLTLYVTAMGQNYVYNDVIRGYDVGPAPQVTLTVYSPNPSGTGQLGIYASTQPPVQPLAFDASGKATAVVDLYQGTNYIYMDDGNGLYLFTMIFSTNTLRPPAIKISVTDDIGTPTAVLDGGKWDFFTTNPGAMKISITGMFTPKSGCLISGQLNYGVNNNDLYASNYGNVPIDAAGNFTLSNIDIYKGVNWMYMSTNDSCGNWYNRQIGVYTDTGTPWVPPIMVTSIIKATKIADYGQMSDWDASASLTNHVQINLQFDQSKLCGTSPSYYAWSDAGSDSGNIYPDSTGKGYIWGFPVYHGMNNISINANILDTKTGSCTQSAWYNIRISTTGGIPAVKTAITSINGTAYNQSGSFTVSGCTAQIAGTAMPGQVSVYWYGFDGTNYYYENNRTVISDPTTSTFNVTVPVVSGPGSYNTVNIYNQNWVSTYVELYTTGNCSYTLPYPPSGTSLAVNTITWSSGPTVTISGRSNPGKFITAYQNTCNGRYDPYSTTADGSGNWIIPNAKVYNGSNGFNVSDGYYSIYAPVSNTVTNGIYMQSGTTITSVVDANNPSNTFTVPAPTANCGAGVVINTGGALAVTVTGTTDEPNSRGYYNIGNGPMGAMTTGNIGPLTFSGGTFTIQNVPVYGSPSPDNYLSMFDAYGTLVLGNSGSWPQVSVDLQSSNAVAMPKYVNITSQTQGGVVSSVPFTVTADITDPTATGWSPTYYQAIAQDLTTNNMSFYSSDPNERASFGYLPITVATASLPTGVLAQVSYDVNQTTGATPVPLFTSTYDIIALGVAGIDWVNMMVHVDIIYVNGVGNSNTLPLETYYKPGAKASGTMPLASGFTAEYLIKKMLMHQAQEMR